MNGEMMEISATLAMVLKTTIKAEDQYKMYLHYVKLTH